VSKPITWVGIDDDKKNLTIGVLRGEEQQQADVRRIANEDGALRRWVRKLIRAADGGEIRMCYEAGPNGFALMRRIEAMGPVVVEVMAPSLTPRRPGQRVKTDPIDAKKLVALYRAGELRAIATPDEESEAARDLVRTYHRVTEEVTRKRHHVLKFLIRRGRIYRDGCHWTKRHREWLRSQDWDNWKDRASVEELVSGLRELEDRRRRLEAALDELAQEDARAMSVAALRCFQGIATPAALTLVTEIFRAQRFARPKELMSYLGLTPTVCQSGDKEWRGGISKAGNRYVRWVLGEVALHYRHRPGVGRALKRRRQGQAAWVIEIADRAHQRLHRRYWALVNRGKPVSKAVAAIARELVGFIWETLMECERRGEKAAA
jgi:transposase